MKFQEWNISIFKSPILGKLIPLELKRTYPKFSIEDGELCASFVGFRVKIEEKTVKLSAPKYYLKVTYPKGKLQSFERFNPAEESYHIAKSCLPEDIKRMTGLCDNIIRLFDEKSSELETAIKDYNALMDNLLESDQLAVIERYSAQAVE